MQSLSASLPPLLPDLTPAFFRDRRPPSFCCTPAPVDSPHPARFWTPVSHHDSATAMSRTHPNLTSKIFRLWKKRDFRPTPVLSEMRPG